VVGCAFYFALTQEIGMHQGRMDLIRKVSSEALVMAMVLAIFWPQLSAGQKVKIKPTTTLQEQLSNNTSAADRFRNSSNGNMGSTHVSKVNVHSLLYSGATTRVYAHLMPWWGDPRHIDAGYNSHDPEQIRRQIEDMISRGIDGVIIDWYGFRDLFTNETALRFVKEVERHPGFTFAIMVDKGAIKLSSCEGCSPQQALSEQMRYAERTFRSSQSYLRVDGRPVITNFDIDHHFPGIEWQRAIADLASPPALIFEDADGFSHPLSSGSYAWVRPSTNDLGMGYLNKFYEAGLAHRQLLTIGAAYKGFDDRMASWGLNRVMKQDCGQTWLKTFARANDHFGPSRQLDALQLVTWNDYEEGTEIESGVDNCLAVNADVDHNTIRWTISGEENTVDHFVFYISDDGKRLMQLDTMDAKARSIDMCSYSLGGKFVGYVQAVGKPMIRSHMSHPLTIKAQCGS
jgi:hypothetical protein